MKTLKQETMEIINGMVEDMEITINEVIEDIINYGCVNDIVPELTCYYQTKAFFDRHKDEINEMAKELSNDMYGNPYELYYNLNGGCSKNTMVWWAFEEMTQRIADEMGLEF